MVSLRFSLNLNSSCSQTRKLNLNDVWILKLTRAVPGLTMKSSKFRFLAILRLCVEHVPIVTTSKKSAKSRIAHSEMALITMLFTVEGGEVKPVSTGVRVGWMVGFSCPNSSISTKPLLENGVPSWSNDTTERKIMGGRGGKKYQTYKVSITWTIGHILCFFL